MARYHHNFFRADARLFFFNANNFARSAPAYFTWDGWLRLAAIRANKEFDPQ